MLYLSFSPSTNRLHRHTEANQHQMIGPATSSEALKRAEEARRISNLPKFGPKKDLTEARKSRSSAGVLACNWLQNFELKMRS